MAGLVHFGLLSIAPSMIWFTQHMRTLLQRVPYALTDALLMTNRADAS